MEKFEIKYEEYKKKFYNDMDKDKENIEKNKDKIDKDKIKEEIYHLVYKSIGYSDIDNIIAEARKDAIDYKDINHNTLNDNTLKYNNKMLEIIEQIIKIQKIVIITKDNIMSLSNKYINFILLYVNKKNIIKINKLFENKNIEDNIDIINRINKIDITKIEYNDNINNGYSIEILEKLQNKKISRIYFLLLNHITQLQQNNITNKLIDKYFYNYQNYNSIKNKIKNLDRNHKIAYEELEIIIKKNIIIISRYLLQDEIITETYLQNKKFLFEIQYKLISKKNIFSLLENYDIKRLRIFKNYLINNLLLLL